MVRAPKKPKDGPSRTQLMLNEGTPWAAFAAGLIVCLPGIWYLDALKDIAQSNPSTATVIVEILVFIVIMFVLGRGAADRIRGRSRGHAAAGGELPGLDEPEREDGRHVGRRADRRLPVDQGDHQRSDRRADGARAQITPASRSDASSSARAAQRPAEDRLVVGAQPPAGVADRGPGSRSSAGTRPAAAAARARRRRPRPASPARSTCSSSMMSSDVVDRAAGDPVLVPDAQHVGLRSARPPRRRSPRRARRRARAASGSCRTSPDCDQVRSADRLKQPVGGRLGAGRDRDEPVIGGPVHVPGRAERGAAPVALVDRAGLVVGGDLRTEEREQRLEQAQVDALPAAGEVAMAQRDQASRSFPNSAAMPSAIGNGGTIGGRSRSPSSQATPLIASASVPNPGRSCVRPGLAETRRADHDQAGVVFGQALVAEVPALHRAGAEVLDQHVGVGDQLQQDLLAVGLGEVERARAFVARRRLPPDRDAVLLPAEAAQRIAAAGARS